MLRGFESHTCHYTFYCYFYDYSGVFAPMSNILCKINMSLEPLFYLKILKKDNIEKSKDNAIRKWLKKYEKYDS